MQETEAQTAYIRATQPYRDMVADTHARLFNVTALLDITREERNAARRQRDEARAALRTMRLNFRAVCVCAGVLILSLAAMAVIR